MASAAKAADVKEEGERVPDLVFVLLTVGLFAALTMAVRAVERL